MMTTRTASMLARYNAWANQLIFDAVAALPAGEATKARQSLFKNMVHTLNHNYVIDRIWQAHLEGREHGYAARNTPDHPSLADLWPRAPRAHHRPAGLFAGPAGWTRRLTGYCAGRRSSRAARCWMWLAEAAVTQGFF